MNPSWNHKSFASELGHHLVGTWLSSMGMGGSISRVRLARCTSQRWFLMSTSGHLCEHAKQLNSSSVVNKVRKHRFRFLFSIL